MTLSDRLYAAKQLLDGLREELEALVDDGEVMERDGVGERLTCAHEDIHAAVGMLDEDVQSVAHVERHGHGMPMPEVPER